MKSVLCLALCAMLLCATAATAAEDKNPFDGKWTTVLFCPNSNDALGYSFKFLSTVKDSGLHGEKGEKDKPGWLTIDGKIATDGSASLYADGIVGAAPYAVGHRPEGTHYGYHIDAKFADASGTGHRVEGRPCDITFAKEK